jgi:nucleotide-binding universal stress UspA family protein
MFENVLVGVDGRQGGRDAIALAQRLTADGARLTLAHAIAERAHPLAAITPSAAAEERAAAEKLLERERTAAGLEAELVALECTTPGAGLHRQAEAQSADLIVVGSSSRGMIGRAALGDDTRGALNGAPCAVAIAARAYAERPIPLAKVGVAYNWSPESAAGLATAREIAAATRAQVLALEVVSIPTYAFTGLVPPAYGETVDVMLKEANDRLAKLEGAEARAVYGLAGEELAAFGDEVDLLVVGSRSYGPLKRLVLGSTSDYLERHARCSLLVLPRGAKEAQAAAPQGS